jgi:predicted homoserine dehydrogenase-like protein
MSLHGMLLARAAEGNPLRIGVIGAGKFGSMYLSQIPTTPGIHLLGIADLSPSKARENLARLGWKPEVTQAGSLAEARRHGNTHLSDDWRALVSHPEIDIIVESTGDPIAAVEHALAAFENGKSVVMVTVEADAFCGPLLAKRAAAAGVIYSLAYGDQPALICELVDWARTSGFEVTAAGRGHKWLPHYAQSTPETVWKYWGLNEEQAKRGGLNPKMFNSFLDGSKPAIESTAVANATGLTPAPDGLAFPPCAVEDLPFVMRPISEGGHLHHKGQVECASSLERDGRAIPYEIRKGVWVVFEAATDYQKNCFEEYMLCTDPSGRYSVMYKRWHLIGLEVGMSVASIGLRKEPTGCAIGFHADVIATAKRDLKAGEMLDGEGGYTVYGKLFPAEKSTGLGSLPLGLAHNVKLLKPIKAGQSLTYADVAMDESLTAVKLRREMEQAFAPAAAKIAAQ